MKRKKPKNPPSKETHTKNRRVGHRVPGLGNWASGFGNFSLKKELFRVFLCNVVFCCLICSLNVHACVQYYMYCTCNIILSRELNCGNHLCELTCHPPPCPSCSLLPSQVSSCPCGAMPLSVLLSADRSRTSCLDPVPTCDSVCGKRLPCSTRGE